MKKVVQKKIEGIQYRASQEICKILKVEIDKEFAWLKKRFPEIAGTEVVLGMGMIGFRSDKEIVLTWSDDSSGPSRVEDFLDKFWHDKGHCCSEIAWLSGNKRAQNIRDLIQTYEENGGLSFVI